jgi:translocation and assembly module TamB
MAGGILQSNFRADALSDLAVNLSVDGAYKPDVALAEPWGQMVQNGANFNADMTLLNNAIRVDEAFVTGENVRAAMSGSLGEELDLSAKVEIAAPFNYAPLSLIGNTDANLTLKGARDNPDLRLDANFEQIQINAFNLRDTRLRAELNDVFMAPKGPVRFNAKTDQGPLDLSTKLASSASAYTADDISLSWGIISATGQISKPLSEPATGQLFLNGAQTEDQFAKASLRLSPLNGRQGISLKADAKNVAFQDFAFDEFKLAADGSLSSLSGKLETRGQRELQFLARQFRVAAPFTISRETDGSYRAAVEPRANYANIELGHVSALTVIYASDEITLDAPLTLAGEPFNLTYERSGPKESVSLKTANLPVTLIPMSGSLADSRGRLAADISLSNAAAIAGLTGGGKISISDWRGFDAKKDSGLFGTLALEVNGREMTWLSDVKSASGFSATSNGVLPLRVSDTLAGFGIAMDAPISGELMASGQASAILGLVTPSDARPQGQLKARLLLSGTAKAPFVKGDASAEKIRMEAPQLGTQLKNGMFAAQFSNDSLSVSDLSIEDKDNGKISGSGQFRLGEFARPIGELNMTANKFRALDRKDYQGTVSGSLGFKSTQNEVSLTGDVTLNRAEVKQFVESKAYVVEIPVEEINKPEEVPLAVVSPPSAPVRLDIRLRGPRRIFIRSRGLDVELSIDAALKGPSNNVEIYGQANVLRGNYKLAGKSLNFDSGGIEFSGTLPDARINLKASTKTPSLAAELVIRGTVSNPEVELSSTPDRPQDEILSALLFGRSATELTALEAAQLAGAIAQFSGSGSGFDLMSGLRDALGVGQLNFALGQDGTAQITGGRYLAKNIYLQVFSGGGVGKTGALIDWEISENIALSSKIQADNDQSFSLKWNKDF